MLIPIRGSHLRLVTLCAGVFLAHTTPIFADDDPVGEVGKTVSAWVKTREETVRAEEKWKQEKALLTATVGGLKDKADSLQDKRDHLIAQTADEREEINALKSKKDLAQQSLTAAEAGLQKLTAELLALRPQLPPRLSDALEMAYRSLGSDTPSPGERMQLAMTVLNRCAQFNAGIEQGQEVIQFEGDQTPVTVDVIYWGLSHGYALDRVRNRAWMGSPGGGKWHWEPLDGAAQAVAKLMAVRVDEADPELVTVPARVDAEGGK